MFDKRVVRSSMDARKVWWVQNLRRREVSEPVQLNGYDGQRPSTLLSFHRFFLSTVNYKNTIMVCERNTKSLAYFSLSRSNNEAFVTLCLSCMKFLHGNQLCLSRT